MLVKLCLRDVGGILISVCFTGCGGILATPTGSFTSPNYPNAYHNYANCVWTVSVSEGSRITLMFTAFDLEDHSSCVYDSLKVGVVWCRMVSYEV